MTQEVGFSFNFNNDWFSFFQASDEERLKQLNDEQLLKLLEEAYHSKKLDDKNKSAFFKVRKDYSFLDQCCFFFNRGAREPRYKKTAYNEGHQYIKNYSLKNLTSTTKTHFT